jgi:hypothetical protein
LASPRRFEHHDFVSGACRAAIAALSIRTSIRSGMLGRALCDLVDQLLVSAQSQADKIERLLPVAAANTVSPS